MNYLCTAEEFVCECVHALCVRTFTPLSVYLGIFNSCCSKRRRCLSVEEILSLKNLDIKYRAEKNSYS